MFNIKNVAKLLMNKSLIHVAMLVFGIVFLPLITMMIYMAGIGLLAMPIINGTRQTDVQLNAIVTRIGNTGGVYNVGGRGR